MTERGREQLQQDLNELAALLVAHRDKKEFSNNQFVFLLANLLGAFAASNEFKSSQVTEWFQKSYNEHLRVAFRNGLLSAEATQRLKNLGFEELLDAAEKTTK